MYVYVYVCVRVCVCIRVCWYAVVRKLKYVKKQTMFLQYCTIYSSTIIIFLQLCARGATAAPTAGLL